MTELEIIALSGPATIQDRGRTGYRRFGVPESGAIDRYALAEGQVLLGNDEDCAALEMPFRGGVFRACGDTVIATSGAEMELDINGRPAPWRSAIQVKNGQVITIGTASVGNYGYLHLCGGIDSTRILNSRSTHATSGIGWKPATGDMLTSHRAGPFENLALEMPGYLQSRTIRIMRGPQSGLFPARDMVMLAEGRFSTGFVRDRMGVRLLGQEATFNASLGVKLISDPIIAGDIQVTADGVATVLLADAQPTGGYPRIATVIGADLPIMAQMPPDVEFEFRLVDREEAVSAWREFHWSIEMLPSRMIRRTRNPDEIRDLLGYNLVSGIVRGDENDDC